MGDLARQCVLEASVSPTCRRDCVAVTSAGPGREAVVGVRKSAGVILPRLLSSPLSLGTAWHVTVLMGSGVGHDPVVTSI